jgi:rhomboid protease GluP
MTMIPAFSKRQVMDWSLVLASQDIPATIVHSEEAGWGLSVHSEDHDRALASIQQYQLENHTWGWRQPIPWSDATFDWGSLGWCLLLILVHSLTLGPLAWFRAAGRFDSALVRQGQWWRAFTAILLHFDLHHLLANVTTGLILFGLAGARYGLGLALFTSYLSGAAGNEAGLLLDPHPYVGLGASGMIMGALGLIAVPPYRSSSPHPRAVKQWLQAGLASIMLFVLLGVDPASDVIAHLGGFVAGALLAVGMNALPETVSRDRRFQTGVWLVFLSLLAFTTWLAAHGARTSNGPSFFGF